MSKKLWTVALVGVVLFLLAELFPPWVYVNEDNRARHFTGYHFLGNPPQTKAPEEMRRLFSLSANARTDNINVARDVSRQYDQRIILICLTLGALLVIHNRRAAINQILAGSFLFIGTTFIGVFILHVTALD